MILAINFAKTFSCRKIAWLWEVVGKLERQLDMILLSHLAKFPHHSIIQQQK
jgi:hypothetical protein